MTPMNHVLHVEGRTIRPKEHKDAVVATSVMADTVQLVVSEPALWDGLDLHVTFEGSGRTVRVAWDGSSRIPVPWECCAEAGGHLRVTLSGVYGSDARAITARMATPLRISDPGSDTSEVPAEPTEDEYATAVREARQAADDAGAAAESAIEAARNAGEAAATASEAATGADDASKAADEATRRADDAAKAAADAAGSAEAERARITQAAKDGTFDGVSVTHSWDGTKLTVTSASGTSAADLKGDTGAQGPKGDKGDKGDKGEDAIVGLTVESGTLLLAQLNGLEG